MHIKMTITAPYLYFSPILNSIGLQIWTLGSPKSIYTISGHSNKVNCLAFFTFDDLEYLVTGSDDQTAKVCHSHEILF
jgi:WD40 repeat protein